MTAHQRRPGFRLPWSSETDQGDGGSTDAEAQSSATDPTASAPAAGAAAQTVNAARDAQPAAASGDEAGAQPESATAETPGTAGADSSTTTTTNPTPEAHMSATTAPPSKPAEDSSATSFLGDLVAAMRRVADEARETTVADLRSRVDEAIREREEDAERRRGELRAKAETDVAAVGEWAKAEAERIKAEAEQRVASRRAQLDRQLAAETAQVDSAAEALRSRIAAYERELESYHDQLAATSDPAAFAAAAKRMPPPPALDGSASVPAPTPEPEPVVAEPEPQQATQSQSTGTNGSAPIAPVADAEGADVSATTLEKLDAKPETPPAAETYAEPVATEIVVKGLGSFGAITGFRQQLANVEGIDAVGLSLGTSGEFVFRATHRPNVDMAAAITALEGDAVEIEPRAEGGLRVTLGRPR
ncbi:MAG: hypothetical protein ACXWWQ_06715 [Candidatus Limnocylindria bacterium]